MREAHNDEDCLDIADNTHVNNSSSQNLLNAPTKYVICCVSATAIYLRDHISYIVAMIRLNALFAIANLLIERLNLLSSSSADRSGAQA